MMNLTTLLLFFWDYALESAIRILNMVPTEKVDKTPYELWYGKVPNLSYLKILKDEDTSPSEFTSEIPMEVEGLEPPEEEVIPIRRSERTHRAPNCLCLNVEVGEHSLRDLNEPASYKAAMLDSESNKWIDAMNTKIQSMIDNMVWVLVDLPPGCALTPKEVNRMQNGPYASAVGSIMYPVRCTRPDVAFVQNIISRFQQNPGELHWTAVKNILKYLRNTKDMFLVYGRNPKAELRVDCFYDARFEIDIDMKSLTGYVSF
uniref:Retrotransposon protein, putative, Ty1-copia subclass n=1 Tax=Tanacetum cinerariifolium TaxID=118510 RepID=A0A699H8V3_TANCI|nr:retrotransposon protein, putative, Ty1-copia subclass [Tanacetum cinerariifolium]